MWNNWCKSEGQCSGERNTSRRNEEARENDHARDTFASCNPSQWGIILRDAQGRDMHCRLQPSSQTRNSLEGRGLTSCGTSCEKRKGVPGCRQTSRSSRELFGARAVDSLIVFCQVFHSRAFAAGLCVRRGAKQQKQSRSRRIRATHEKMEAF